MDTETARADLVLARERLFENKSAPRRRGPARPLALAATTFVACAAVLLLWLVPRRALTFRVAEQRGSVGAWLSSESTRDLPVRFSDGSSLLLRNSARARVEQVDAASATIRLEFGELAVSVVHRHDTRWLIEAGPYRVHVIGTRFDVSFDSDRQQFSLALHDGSVRLEGPGLASGRVVVAGQRVTLERGVELAPEAEHARPNASPSVPASTEPSPADALAAAPIEPSEQTRAQAGAPLDDWLAIARRADYAGALAAAGRVGINSLLASARVDDLLLLGDCAFYRQQDALARQIYLVVRTRGPRSLAAGAAAFNLGSLAFRSSESQSEAARWFRTYLREQPRGALRREVLGRLLEAERASEQFVQACETAHAYLQSYPGGPHAEVAREVLEAATP